MNYVKEFTFHICAHTVDAAMADTVIADKPSRDGILPNKIRRIMRTSVVYYEQSSGIHGSRLTIHNDFRVEIESYVLFVSAKREFKRLHCSVPEDISLSIM